MKDIKKYIKSTITDSKYDVDLMETKPIYLNGKKSIYIARIDGSVYSTNYNHTGKIKQLKTSIGHDGYEYIMLPDNGKRKNYRLNRLLAKTFIPLPKRYLKLNLTYDDLEVNHKDGNPLNNNIYNLEWLTPLENKKHAKDNNLIKSGEDNPNSKINKTIVIQICQELIKNELNQSDIAKKFHVSYDIVHSIYKKETWKNITKKYNFSCYKVKGKSNQSIGEKNVNCSINEKTAKEICKLIVENKLSQKEIADKLNTTVSIVSKILYKKSWIHISSSFDFSKYNIDGRCSNEKSK